MKTITTSIVEERIQQAVPSNEPINDNSADTAPFRYVAPVRGTSPDTVCRSLMALAGANELGVSLLQQGDIVGARMQLVRSLGDAKQLVAMQLSQREAENESTGVRPENSYGSHADVSAVRDGQARLLVQIDTCPMHHSARASPGKDRASLSVGNYASMDRIWQYARVVRIHSVGSQQLTSRATLMSIENALNVLVGCVIHNLALQLHLQAAQLYHDGHPSGQVFDLLNRARVMYEKVQAMSARNSMGGSEASMDPTRKSAVLNNLALVYGMLGDRTSAATCWEHLATALIDADRNADDSSYAVEVRVTPETTSDKSDHLATLAELCWTNVSVFLWEHAMPASPAA